MLIRSQEDRLDGLRSSDKALGEDSLDYNDFFEKYIYKSSGEKALVESGEESDSQQDTTGDNEGQPLESGGDGDGVRDEEAQKGEAGPQEEGQEGQEDDEDYIEFFDT